MAKEMLINVSEGEECRIALVEDGRLEELYMERTSATSHVGNIYKGRVTNVEPSIQAAFVDFGLGRNGFLHISDLMPTYFGRRGEEIQESVGRKMARRDRPPIQRCLRRGDDITVQIIKEGIGTKGPTLSTYLSIPGRILVMMPGMDNFGVSRKIEDEDERRRLRGILDSLDPVEGVGFIIRTAGMGKTKADIQKDLTYLTRLWQQIDKKLKEPAPVELYTEGDLVTRTVRDFYSSDVERVIIDNKEVARRVKEIIKLSAPRTKNKVELYEDPVPLFHKYGIEREIEMMNSRHVPLPSGGSLVIDSTEAIVAIDVNSGKFREHADAETTAFKTDMEAADEIPRQLKLRDLGGVIICDFIDLRYERHRRDLEHRLHENFKRDRAKTKVLRMSQFGIIELTRQRMRPSLKRSIYCDCPHCKGAGLVKTPESMSLDVMRRLAIAAHDQRVARVELAVCSDVNHYLQNKKRAQLAALETDTGKKVNVRQDPALGLDEMKLELYDAREGRVYLDELGMVPEHLQDDRGGRGGRGRDRGGRDRHRQQQQQQGRGGHPSQQQGGGGRRDDRHGGGREEEMERGAEEVEEREEGDEPSAEDVSESGVEVESDPQQQQPRQQQPPPRRDDRRHQQQQPPPPRGQQPRRDDQHRRDDRGGRPDDRHRQGGGGGGGDRHQQPPRHDGRRDDRPRDDRQRQGGGQPPHQQRGGGPQQQQPGRPAQPGQGGQPQHQQHGGGGAGGGEQQPGVPGEGGGRRRRRRRRRGRGRGGMPGDQQQQGVGAAGMNGAPMVEGGEEFEPDPDIGPTEPVEAVPTAEADERRRELVEASVSRDVDDDADDDRDAVEDTRDLDRNVEAADADEEIGEAPQAIEDEPADEVAPAAEAPAEEVEEPKPATRGRRGRGGGRGGASRASTRQQAEARREPPKAKAAVAAEDEAGGTKPEAAGKSDGGAKPKRRRGGRGRSKAAKAEEAGEAGSAPATTEASMPEAPAAPVLPPPVVRTGSTDKHQLVDDVPVEPEPVRRPRSRRDLDAIPDDFD